MGRVVINRQNGGLGRRPANNDGVIGIVGSGYAAGSYALGDVMHIKSLKDFEEIGYSEATDVTASKSVYKRIKELYRLNPIAEVYLMIVADTVSQTTMLGVGSVYADKLLTQANGKIRHLATFRNPHSGYSPLVTSGIDDEITAASGAIDKAQLLATAFSAKNMPIHVYIEGRSFTGTASAALDLRTLDRPDVSIVLAQDLNYGLTGDAAIETIMGLVSRSRVNDSIAWVQPNNIQNPSITRWIAPGLSSGLALSAYSDSALTALNDKGYITPMLYPRESTTAYAGCYINDCHSCVGIESDYAYFIESNVMNKAARLVFNAILPELNSTIKVDPVSGQIAPDVCAYFKTLGERAIQPMLNDSEISGFTVTVDPEQNILTTGQLVIDYSIIPTGIAREIIDNIGFTNPFS